MYTQTSNLFHSSRILIRYQEQMVNFKYPLILSVLQGKELLNNRQLKRTDCLSLVYKPENIWHSMKVIRNDVEYVNFSLCVQ